MADMPPLNTLTDAEFTALDSAVTAERSRRAVLTSAPEQIAAQNLAYLDAAGIEQGEPWVAPTGAHNAYPKDWMVTHNSKTWISLVDANVWEPGVANWAIYDPGTGWPAWVQPSGSTDAYPAGAKVSHVERHWTSDVDANVWEPGVYGWTEALE